MPEKIILCDLNLNQNAIVGAALESRGSPPTSPVDGQMYWNSDKFTAYMWDGTEWQDLLANEKFIATCPFGANSDNVGRFLCANGKSNDADQTSKARTRQPIIAAGTLTKLAYLTDEGSTSTQMKIHINGSVVETVVLSSLNANGGGVEDVDVTVSAGDYVEIEYDASQKPGECTMYFLQSLD